MTCEVVDLEELQEGDERGKKLERVERRKNTYCELWLGEWEAMWSGRWRGVSFYFFNGLAYSLMVPTRHRNSLRAKC